ncbi:DUF302 domain-containing protein [Acidithiobacillus caldus]|uniref:DUF302 domain-containing protein n=3 Tax=Acidithiobacillus caldus TaxID=33059 RepID=UPI001C076DB4|nr:DUF302 domain-containing protein [Acidithiobacillus caldus]MBU2764304.1 DUF302 domain-containing protein [Acidithiobacillus caldus]MBU2803179.1 DUF302 domain-containing protein [Acidithiobacillus caldus]
MRSSVKMFVSVVVAMFLTSVAGATDEYVETIAAPISQVAPELARALSTHHFKVVMHLDILKRIEAKEKVLHIPDLNKDRFTDVQAFVFCNPMFFSQLLNSDWKYAALCPLNLTVYGKGASTVIVYPERIAYAQKTPANRTAQRIDSAVIAALKSIPKAN